MGNCAGRHDDDFFVADPDPPGRAAGAKVMMVPGLPKSLAALYGLGWGPANHQRPGSRDCSDLMTADGTVVLTIEKSKSVKLAEPKSCVYDATTALRDKDGKLVALIVTAQKYTSAFGWESSEPTEASRAYTHFIHGARPKKEGAPSVLRHEGVDLYRWAKVANPLGWMLRVQQDVFLATADGEGYEAEPAYKVLPNNSPWSSVVVDVVRSKDDTGAYRESSSWTHSDYAEGSSGPAPRPDGKKLHRFRAAEGVDLVLAMLATIAAVKIWIEMPVTGESDRGGSFDGVR